VDPSADRILAGHLAGSARAKQGIIHNIKIPLITFIAVVVVSRCAIGTINETLAIGPFYFGDIAYFKTPENSLLSVDWS
jgi:uncharacterized membrane protein YGL010W